MRSQLAAGFVVLGLAIAPTGFAADNKATETPVNKATETPTKPPAPGGVQENVSDATITAKIKTEFAKDKVVSAMNINIDTDNKGAVTLKGTAKSKDEAAKAESIAKNVKGVTSVKNELVVAASTK